jgi:hypothetical protein
MNNKGYTANWKAAENEISADDYKSEPLNAQDVARLNSYAQVVLKSLEEQTGKPAGYDAASVQLLSAGLERIRAKLDDEGRNRLANIYGAYLGFALLNSNPSAGGVWVRTKDGAVAIRFDKAKNGMTMFAMPITRVFKHIDEGDTYSIYSYFLAMPEALSADPLARNNDKAANSGTAKEQPDEQAQRIQIGRAKDGSDLVIAIPGDQCCNCGSRKALKQVESPMRHRRALDGREVRFALNLPYCKACSYTAGREPARLMVKTLAVVVAYSLLLFGVLMPLSVHPFFAHWNGVLLILFTLGTIGFFYWIRHPRSPQTSVYQPVQMTKFSGDVNVISCITFKFSSKSYANAFSGLNKHALSKGLLKLI